MAKINPLQLADAQDGAFSTTSYSQKLRRFYDSHHSRRTWLKTPINGGKKKSLVTFRLRFACLEHEKTEAVFQVASHSD